jgi:hypothetical protein
MRLLLVVIFTLVTSQAFALSPGFLGMASGMGGRTVGYGTFSINGVSSIEDGVIGDTGTEYLNLGAGSITVAASCHSESGNESFVILEVDGVERDSVSCLDTSDSATLTYTVTAGTHAVRVHGSSEPDPDSFSGGTFTSAP